MLSPMLKIKYAIIYPFEYGSDLTITEQESYTLSLDLLLSSPQFLNNERIKSTTNYSKIPNHHKNIS